MARIPLQSVLTAIRHYHLGVAAMSDPCVPAGFVVDDYGFLRAE